MKKVLASLGAAAMLLTVAGTALAAQSADRGGSNVISNTVTNTTTVAVSNDASVANLVGSTASTGNNTVSSHHGDVKGVTMVTGNASSAATVNNSINGTSVTLNAPVMTSESPAMGPDQSADRGGSNAFVNAQADTATVAAGNSVEAMNGVLAGSSTGNNKVSTHHGDVADVGVGTGTAGGTTSVGNVFNVTTFTITR